MFISRSHLTWNFDADENNSSVNMAMLSKTAHTTHCPWKGEASYYSVNLDSESSVFILVLRGSGSANEMNDRDGVEECCLVLSYAG